MTFCEVKHYRRPLNTITHDLISFDDDQSPAPNYENDKNANPHACGVQLGDRFASIQSQLPLQRWSEEQNTQMQAVEDPGEYLYV